MRLERSLALFVHSTSARIPYHSSIRIKLTTLFFRERSPDLPKGMFNWFGTFSKIPDSYVLNHHSLDGYLLLRYLKISVAMCFVGCLITWPILFPVNATGGGGQVQLNVISFSNIQNTKNRYYAHTFVGWIFFSKQTHPGIILVLLTKLQASYSTWSCARASTSSIFVKHIFCRRCMQTACHRERSCSHLFPKTISMKASYVVCLVSR